MRGLKPYLVTAEFCSRLMIDPNDLKYENYENILNMFAKSIKLKIDNGELLENIVSIKEDTLDY